MGVAFYAPKHFRWVCFRVFLRARKFESGARSPQIASKNGFYAKCAPAHFAARIAQFVSAVDKVGIVRATRVHDAELRSICSQCLLRAQSGEPLIQFGDNAPQEGGAFCANSEFFGPVWSCFERLRAFSRGKTPEFHPLASEMQNKLCTNTRTSRWQSYECYSHDFISVSAGRIVRLTY